MNGIRVFDENLALLGEIDDFESLSFTRGWYAPGDFSIAIERRKQNSKLLRVGRFVQIDRSPIKSGFISSITARISEDGKESILVTGHQLTRLLSRRIVFPPTGYARWEHQGKAEKILKDLVVSQIGAGAPAERQFPQFSVAPNQNRGGTYLLSARYSNLLDEISEAAYATGVSAGINLVNGSFVFDVSIGVDRTASQSVNGRAIFSFNLGTIKGGEIRHSDIGLRNYALVGGQGVGVARALVAVCAGSAEPSGLDRREVFIDARDVVEPTLLPGRGAAKLAAALREDFYDVSLLGHSSLCYGIDYELGDIVTIHDADEAVDQRITEITETWDETGYSIDATFGVPMPTARVIAEKNSYETAAILSATEVSV